MRTEFPIKGNPDLVTQMIEFGGDNFGHDIVRNEAFRRNQYQASWHLGIINLPPLAIIPSARCPI
jgi:hypothetical protein